MDRDQFRQIGEVMYGPRWKTEIARALGVSLRTVQRWAAGTHKIPRRAAAEVYMLLKMRSDYFDAIYEVMTGRRRKG